MMTNHSNNSYHYIYASGNLSNSKFKTPVLLVIVTNTLLVTLVGPFIFKLKLELILTCNNINFKIINNFKFYL